MDYKVRSTSNDWKARSGVRKPKHGLQGTLDIKRLESQIRSKKPKTWTTRYARHQTIGKSRSGVRNPKHGLQGTLDIKRLESQIRSKKTKTWTTRYARHQTIGKPDQE